MAEKPSRLPPVRPAASAALSNHAAGRIDRLLAAMTLEEKLGQLSQGRTGSLPPTGPETRKPFDDLLGEVRAGRIGSILSPHGAAHINSIQRIAVNESRLGIPILIANDIIHGYRTIFPVPLGEAATWRPAVVEQDAHIAAAESRAEGTHWTFAPMVDVCRDPRWGRIVETSGEDPFLGAVMTAAKVRGFQGRSLAAPDAVLACAKHFAAYGFAEGGRDYGTVDLSIETLHEVPLRPFLAAARTGVGSIMTAFNEVNGVPASGNRYILRDVLRRDWGWNGLVVSDWESTLEMIPHGFAADEKDAARLSLLAGLDVEMSSTTYRDHAAALLAEGSLQMPLIDQAVRRVLEAKEKLGLFDHPYTDEALAGRVVLSPESRAHAREAARRSFVLLKNGNANSPAPLPIHHEVRIALIGPLADNPRAALGTWAGFGRDEDVVTIKTSLEQEPGVIVHAAQGSNAQSPLSGGIEAVEAAIADSDIVIAVVGETDAMNGEGLSRADITVPPAQMEVLAAARRAADARHIPLVVLLMCGRPLALPWIAEHADAVMVIWHPGIECGPAIADVVFGRAAPSGRLPVSFPRDVNQVPVFYNHKSSGRPFKPHERYVNRYLDQSNEPLFPFGFGLGYSTFTYSAPHISHAATSTDGSVTVTMQVHNTGAAGGTVAQLYFQDPIATRTRPVRQLVAFEPLDLNADETRTVSWTIAADQFAFYSANPGGVDEGWVVEPREIRLFAGGDSTTKASTSLRLTGLRRTGIAPPSP